jgi:hypothetical protein
LSDKWIVFLPAGTWQKNTILLAKHLGYKVFGVDSDPAAEGLMSCDKSLVLGEVDIFSLADYFKDEGLDIVGALSISSDFGVVPCSLIREGLGLPGLRPAEAELFTNKHLQREHWSVNNVPGPKWVVVREGEPYLAKVESLTFPLIVKPSDSSGSRGVNKINELAELDSAIEVALGFSNKGTAVVEEYMHGTEFTVEVFCSNFQCEILMITQKIKVPGTDDTVAKELFNPILAGDILSKISEAVKSAFQSLNYKSGPGHAEIIMMPNGQVGMVEVAARGGGFLIFDEMIPRTSGIDIAKLTIDSATGVNFSIPRPKKNKSILRFIESIEGQVKSISIPSQENLPKGLLIRPLIQVGQLLREPKSDGDRMCAILATSSNMKETQELVEWALDNIEIVVK